MTPKKLIALLLAAKLPEDVFGNIRSLAELKETYRGFMALVHPDVAPGRDSSVTAADCHTASTTLGNLNDFAIEKVTNGTYGDRTALRKPIIVTTKKEVFTLSNTLPGNAIASRYAGTNQDGVKIILKAAKVVRDNELLENEAAKLKEIFTNDQTKANANTLQLLPKVLASFRNISKDQMVVVFEAPAHKGYSLEEVRSKYPNGVPLEHAAWMFNRIVGALTNPHLLDILHGSLVPKNVIIYPATHGATLINWDYSLKAGEVLKGVMCTPAQRNFYDPELLKKKEATLSADIFSAAKLFIYLVGGDINRATFPDWTTLQGASWTPAQARAVKKIEGTIRTCVLEKSRRPDAFELFAKFRDALKEVFGPPAWREFVM